MVSQKKQKKWNPEPWGEKGSFPPNFFFQIKKNFKPPCPLRFPTYQNLIF
ncbi:hypothetical protein EBI_27406 [Enterocytozoon bieneusi H348]|nr:hypothetical protein EBI_27406 [Enterocytozoon bieneusi H348]|eukprot:XP_002651433.1 hypothetical protein EBI_27406 [Enterocytozoon bieneusi H348]